MAAEDINKKGGVTAGGKKYTFDAVCEDDKVNAAEATAASLLSQPASRLAALPPDLAQLLLDRLVAGERLNEAAALLLHAAGAALAVPNFL